MSFLCLPLRSAKPKAKPKLAQRKSSKQSGSDGLSVPTNGEYFFEGVKISLQLLGELADVIPVPYVSKAVTIVRKVIQKGENTKSNMELLDNLNDRICALMIVLIQPLKGKRTEEVPADMETSINRITAILEEIANVLDNIANQNYLLLLLFQSKNAEKVASASQKIDQALEHFSVSTKIEEAVRLCGMATDIRHMAQELTEIKTMLVQQAHSGSSASAPPIPRNSSIFYGRDVVVKDIVNQICGTESSNVALLGRGGIGKTAVALSIINSPEVEQHFGTKCFWVPCNQADSPSRLLDIMVKHLNITQNTANRLEDIISELNATTDSRIIMFDNFETVWNLDQQVEISNILNSIEEIPHLSILVTMRSEVAPSSGIEWRTQKLYALEVETARTVYIKIHDQAERDDALDHLLSELDHVPLAITLMAALGKTSGFMPTRLLDTWKNIGTDMLSRNADPNRSVNCSIRLSVESPLMASHPDAPSLLTTISKLPGGANFDLLQKIFPSTVDIPGAVAAITQSALAEYRSNTDSIHVHALIRSYMLTHHNLNAETQKKLHQTFCQIVSDHSSKPGDAKYSEDTRVIAAQESNIHAILLDAAQGMIEHATLEALVSFSWYQCWTRPSEEIVDRAIEFARNAPNSRLQLANALLCRGQVCQQLGRYDIAVTSTKEAREIFLKIKERRLAAECLLKLGGTYAYQHLPSDQYGRVIRLAQTEFQDLGEELGIAESLQHLGMYLWYRCRFSEAHEALEDARHRFEKLGRETDAAMCRAWDSRVYFELKQYPQARDAVLDALPVLRRSGDKDSIVRCQIRLTRALKEMLQVSSTAEQVSLSEQAFRAINEGLKMALEQGSPLAIGQLYEELGDICRLREDYETARSAYEQALGYYKRLGHNDQGGTSRCKGSLRAITSKHSGEE